MPASNSSPGATTVTRSATSGASSRIRAATASMVNTGASVRAQVVGQVVVGVLVGDQHRVRAVDGLGIGEHPGVDDDHRAVVLDPDAGMPELRDPHAASLGTLVELALRLVGGPPGSERPSDRRDPESQFDCTRRANSTGVRR